jgi:outer membrane protein assembly factor BamD
MHEVHVARYYMSRGAYVAAANRARYVVENYQRTPAMPDALVVLAKSYKAMQLPQLSQDAVRVLELNFPDHPGIEEVAELDVD